MAPTTLQPIPDRAQAAMLDLFRLTLDADEPTIFSVAIELAVEVTHSEIGYLHLVNDDQATIELGTWSAGTLDRCTAVYDRHYPISEAGVWADSARLRQPVVHNDYPSLGDRRGLPEGHVPLVRHMGVPVVGDGRVVLLVGVGNKPTDYDSDDLACFQAIAEQAWAIIRKRRERVALELAARQLHDLEDVAAIVAWQWDPEERRLVFDRSARGVFGVDLPDGAPCDLDVLLRYIDARDHRALQDALGEPAEDSAFALDLRAVRADGVDLTVHMRGAAFPRSQGHGILLRGILQDVTERRELSRIRYAAGHDALTGLANRASLLAEMETALRNHGRRPDDAFAIHFVDLDRFKEVNDRLGHLAGDVVLKVVAQRLLRATRKDDLVARLGGDELVVVQRHVASAAAAEALATKIIAAVRQPMRVSGHHVEVGASVGIAIAAPGNDTAEALLSRADRAMYLAKETRRGGYSIG